MLNWMKILRQEQPKIELLGELKLSIGWEITKTGNGISPGRKKYIQRILRKENFTYSALIATPLPFSCQFAAFHESDNLLKEADHRRYRPIIGAVI